MKRRTFLGVLGALFLPTVAVAKTIVENKITPPTEEEDFYQFFLNFNGFPINEMQKAAFKQRYSENNIGVRNRRSGVTTFLMTLAAWETIRNNKKVVVASSYYDLSKLFKNEFRRKCELIGIYTPPIIDFMVANNYDHNIRGKSFDVCLYDCSGQVRNIGYFESLEYCHRHNGGYSLLLQTTEPEGVIYGNYIPIIKQRNI